MGTGQEPITQDSRQLGRDEAAEVRQGAQEANLLYIVKSGSIRKELISIELFILASSFHLH